MKTESEAFSDADIVVAAVVFGYFSRDMMMMISACRIALSLKINFLFKIVIRTAV